MNSLSHQELSKHTNVLLRTLMDRGSLTLVPRSTLKALLQDFPTPAKDFAQQIRLQVIEQSRYQPGDDWWEIQRSLDRYTPYRTIFDDIRFLDELPGGRLQGMALCVEVGTEYFFRWGGESRHGVGVVLRRCIEFDYTYLCFATALQRTCVEEKVVWDVEETCEELFDFRDNFGDLDSDRWEREYEVGKEEREIQERRVKDWMFPVSAQYARELHSRQVARFLVPMIAGCKLPPELVELICEEYYDGEFVESAPKLTFKNLCQKFDRVKAMKSATSGTK